MARHEERDTPWTYGMHTCAKNDYTCLTAHCLHMQIIMDMEEHPGGAVSNYVQISDIVRQMQQKVEAMHACHCYHISHVYTQVWIPPSLPCMRGGPLRLTSMPTGS